MSEASRALAYQAQAERRAEFRASLVRKLTAPDTRAIQTREAWAPLSERTKPGERENEEIRPIGVANG